MRNTFGGLIVDANDRRLDASISSLQNNRKISTGNTRRISFRKITHLEFFRWLLQLSSLGRSPWHYEWSSLDGKKSGSHLKLQVFSNTFSCFLALKLFCRPKTLNMVSNSLGTLFLIQGKSCGSEMTNSMAPKFMNERGAWLRKRIFFRFHLFVAKK